ncbi:MAG: T9SS type A sorting domain-containing protein [Bacteroidota bacterium]|jgi:hypothetical protein|nr:T9SS type A sorting domain-containing protein [Cytophagales bacterium]MCE2956924.1 T9SS type A sorting domain-containing protein [Flammeovirgaceae bacterium]MCZ8072228.1 T9SS type A sorting domain-containing protein [Cytophagales bacterium]
MKMVVRVLIAFMVPVFSFSQGKIGVIVNKDIATAIQPKIQQYVADLAAIEKVAVWLNNSDFNALSSASALRDSLRHHYIHGNLTGVVFVGDLPITYYELREDVHGIYSFFPCDVYFMDLNGVWLDTATNGTWGVTGYFDQHVGNRTAEIWMSRIIGSNTPALGNELTVLNNYFDRLHLRMTGQDDLPRKMCIFGSDVEFPTMESWINDPLLGYKPDEMVVYRRSTPAMTDSQQNWIKVQQEGVEYSLVFEHSYEYGHSMNPFFSHHDYLSMTPQSNSRFYYLVAACLVSRYTVPNSLGLLYAMGHQGLLAIGSTKESGIGGGREVFHKLLGQNHSFGAAHKEWHNKIVLDTTVPEHIQEYMLKACYGFVIMGAGNLKLNKYNVITGSDPKPGKQQVNVFPNPFSSSTSISYTLAEPGNVVISVYNLQGVLVSTLVNANQLAGEHVVEFSGSDLPSGLYHVRVQSANKIETGKMMVAK